MIALLASHPNGTTPERVRELCQTVPSERWGLAAERDTSGQAAELVPEILASYEVFLEFVADEEQTLDRLRNAEERRLLRTRAGEFGDRIAQLVGHVTDESQFRRLVV